MEISNYIYSRIKKYYKRFVWRLTRIRLQPIHIFLFHQVADNYDESTMYMCDYTATEQFKRNISILTNKYEFISLTEAYKHIQKDFIRTKKYAVLTSDDGWASLKNILPWLYEQNIPVTLFVNTNYADGKSYREKQTEKYLCSAELEELCVQYPTISIGMHGLEHINVSQMTKEEFSSYVDASIDSTSKFKNYVPFWAYTWGKSSPITDEILKNKKIIPVYIRGGLNYNIASCLDRELLDGKQL